MKKKQEPVNGAVEEGKKKEEKDRNASFSSQQGELGPGD